MREIAKIEAEIETWSVRAERFVRLAEEVLEIWLEAHERAPTAETVEGSRLLALHRAGACGDPSFNACRESCRELVYRRSLLPCRKSIW